MNRSMPCTHYPCGRTTRDPSGLCHDHRSPTGRPSNTDLLPAPIPASTELGLPPGTTVTSSVNPLTGETVENYRRANGYVAGLSSRTISADGVVIAESYVAAGVSHRDDGPARVRFHPDGSPKTELYYLRGELHREDGPAVIEYAEDGTVVRQEWYVRAQRHRLDGPAEVSGVIEQWWLNGKRHRADGPARVRRDPEGRVVGEQWSFENSTHRLDGPAMIGYADDGSIETEKWYVAGKECADVAEFARKIRRRPVEELTESFARGPYAPLLDEGVPVRKIVGVMAQGVRTPEGVREALGGAPAEWVRSFEESRS